MPSTDSVVVALITAVALAGCAGVSGGSTRYAAELEALQRSCLERGGILIPAQTRQATGRPPADYACRIDGGGRPPSR